MGFHVLTEYRLIHPFRPAVTAVAPPSVKARSDTSPMCAVRARLAAAGVDRPLFPDDALSALHELSQGALREIDRLATAALREAARRKKKLVDREIILHVAEPLARFE
jgi:hypothetical protein